MSHETLGNWYKVTFAMAQHHKWSVSELEDLYPYERSIYVELLKQYLKELEEKMEKQRRGW